MSKWNQLNANISVRVIKPFSSETVGDKNNADMKAYMQDILEIAPKFETGCEPLDIFLNQSGIITMAVSDRPGHDHGYFVISLFGMFRDFDETDIVEQFEQYISYLKPIFKDFLTYSVKIC